MHKLRLYVAGSTLKSERIIKNLKQLLDDEFNNQYALEIIDVIDKPELAERDNILATPTLIKIEPYPVRRIIGDFSNKDMVLQGLDLVKPT
jgi:circadian clock protein KaiB